MTPSLRELLRNEYVQTIIMIGVVIALVFGFWYGSQAILHSQYPALAVASGSMCKLPGDYCDGWSHPFERTLHVGDLIIIQGVDPEDIHAAPEPFGDIIVFRAEWANNELIVHRAISSSNSTGELLITTKGDGNDVPDSATRVDHVIGKVVGRIPWVGHLALLMRNSSVIFIVILLIVILLIVEIIIPMIRHTTPEPKDEEKEKIHAENYD